MPAPAATVEISADLSRVTRATLQELWRYREVLTAFATRAVKVRYKQTSIGIAWALLQPLAATAVFAVVFGRFVKLPSEGAPYAIFALAGMVGWIYFSSAAMQTIASVVNEAALLRKVFFPREIIPLAVLIAGLVDFAATLFVFLVATVIAGIEPSVTWMAAPIFVVILIMAVAAFGLALSSLNVYYRDVQQITPFLMMIGFYASPIVYSLEMIPAGWRDVYAVANPVAGVIDGLRGAFLRHDWPDPVRTAVLFAFVATCLVGAYVLFKRLERGFADRV